MTPSAAAVLSLILLSATTATAGTLHSSPGTFGAYPKSGTSMSPPRPPAPPASPASPGYHPKADTGGFKPWKPSMRTDSTRGGVDAYPGAKKPKGYISPY